MTNMDLVVKGSITDVTQGGDVALTLMDAKLVVICDRSASMEEGDAGGGKARYVVEDEVVTKLQGKYPGQIVLISFNDMAFIALDGRLPFPSGGTDMANAISMAVPLVESGLRAVLISDGEPNPSTEDRIFHEAKRMNGKLDTIFVGKEHSKGDKFLKKLAQTAGGTHQVNEATKMLDQTLTVLLLKAGGG